MMNDEKKIFVYSDWNDNIPQLLGTLYVNVIRGKELFSFEYDNCWLKENPFRCFL
ncbi:hypothetical protein M2145_000946 [Lachnospiraceae bacterium PF1-21]|uniref:hypothetical protein n=1 Tax=Ohessyouella blattaphilus TaxID=2949333 RepID=UPI003E2B254C